MRDGQPSSVSESTGEPFFIAGSPRSGTTLLERILNRHSRLFIPPETEFFFLLGLHGLLGKPYVDRHAARFLDIYLKSRPAKMLGLPDNAPLMKMRLLENARSYRDLFVRLMEFLREPSCKPRWGEKTPHHLQSAGEILELFPASPMIVLLRDGRAVTRSRLQKPGWEKNLFAAARVWQKDSQRLIGLLCSHFRERILTVRYEELVRNPWEVVPRACGFLGEAFEPQMLDPNAASEGARFGSYYEQSWMAKASSDIDPASIDAWRSAFTGRELALINHLQGADLHYWGYPVEQPTRQSGWKLTLIKEQLRHAIYRARMRMWGHLSIFGGLWARP